MYKVADLFAGAGGFGLGFRLAGYTVSFSLEIDHWAADTLRANKLKSTIVVEDDIKKYRSKEKILKSCENDVPSVVIGGPPCQGFSIAGRSYDPNDPRNSLFIDFARWVYNLKPRFFIMENVKGILTRKNANKEDVVDIIVKTFNNFGYQVGIWTLNAAEYGVPQMRERVFFIGNRLGKIIDPPPITHSISKLGRSTYRSQVIKKLPSFVTVDNAISDLPRLHAGEGEEKQQYTSKPTTAFQKWARAKQFVLYNHVAMKHTTRMIERFNLIRSGQSVIEIPEQYKAKKRNGNGQVSNALYDSNNRRLNPKGLSYTIPAYFYSSFVHPHQDRNITAREAARIQSFPDWYRFMGKRTVVSHKLLEKYNRYDENFLSQYNQIGNAVPPLLAMAIANHIKQYLD